MFGLRLKPLILRRCYRVLSYPMTLTFPVSSPAQTEWSAAQAAQRLSTWRCLLHLGPPDRCGEHVTLFEQGDEPREIFVLATGIIKLTCNLPNGQRSLLMLRYPGDLVEGCTNRLELPYPVTGTTVTPCQIHRLSRTRIAEAERHNPEINAFEKYVLARDLYNQYLANVEIKTLNSIELLERRLWEIAMVQTGGRIAPRMEFVLPLNNAEMAEWLGMSESHYKQTRCELERTGRLRRSEGKRFIFFPNSCYSVPSSRTPDTEIESGFRR
jgi:CRP-like cAMP-binding protein